LLTTVCDMLSLLVDVFLKLTGSWKVSLNTH
jgi:hypothetical protein